MTDVLISFIGASRPQSGAMTARSGYEQVTYRFPDRTETTTSLFGWGLWQFLSRTEKPCDRWVVLGTPTSEWGRLCDALEGEAFDLGAAIWQDKARDAIKLGGIEQALLQEGEEVIGPNLGLNGRLRLRIVPLCANLNEQKRLLQILLDELGEGDNVVVDITHAFRHLPALLAFYLSSLQWLKGIKTAGLYYGARDMSDATGVAPVIDLSYAACATEVGAQTAVLELTGNYRALAEALPALSEPINQASFLEDINRLGDARKPAGKVLHCLPGSEEPLEQSVVQRLRPAVEWSEAENLPARMLQKAQFFRQHGEYMKSTVIGYQALMGQAAKTLGISRDIQHHNKDECKETGRQLRDALNAPDEETLLLFRQLRNSVAHGTNPQKVGAASLMRALSNRQEFEALLDRGLDLTRRVIAGEVALARS